MLPFPQIKSRALGSFVHIIEGLYFYNVNNNHARRPRLKKNFYWNIVSINIIKPPLVLEAPTGILSRFWIQMEVSIYFWNRRAAYKFKKPVA